MRQPLTSQRPPPWGPARSDGPPRTRGTGPPSTPPDAGASCVRAAHHLDLGDCGRVRVVLHRRRSARTPSARTAARPGRCRPPRRARPGRGPPRRPVEHGLHEQGAAPTCRRGRGGDPHADEVPRRPPLRATRARPRPPARRRARRAGRGTSASRPRQSRLVEADGVGVPAAERAPATAWSIAEPDVAVGPPVVGTRRRRTVTSVKARGSSGGPLRPRPPSRR